MRRMTGCVIGVVLTALGGCSRAILPGSVPQGSMLTLSNVSSECVFCAAQTAVTQNYRIETMDRDRGVIQTLPQEYEASDASVSLADVLGPSSRTFRRIVSVQVRPAGEKSASISVRVDLQRRDTVPMEAFAYQRQGDDRPDQRYTNGAAALDKEKREVWTTVRRDFQTEREILNLIRELARKECKLAPATCPAAK